MIHEFRRRLILAGSAVALLGLAASAAAQTVLADVHGLRPREIKVEAFSLPTAQEVRVAAIGEEGDRNSTFTWVRSMWTGRDEPREPWAGNAWILDLQSRRAVWELSASTTTRGRRGTREFSGTVRLPAGSYAAYVSAFPPGYNEKWEDGHRLAAQFFGADGIDDYKLVVQGSGQRLTSNDVERFRKDAASGAFISFRGSSPEQLSQTGFTLDKPTAVEVYAIGEARENASYDYGWIINADTHEKIWKLEWRGSSPAGGAVKNRMIREKRTLPAGRYAAFYATDDSHDQSAWNSPPPHDPDFWGLTVRVTDSASSGAVKTFAYEHVPSNATILALTRIGDKESKQQGFTLNKPMDVRIYAIGEGRDGRMFDYGWITNGESRRRIWEMRYEDTEHAGGDPKNRLVDTKLHLEKGSYIVHYVSDGSHSADEWNAAAPADGRHWGITVLSSTGAVDKRAIGPYVESTTNSSVIAAITEVRDDDSIRKRFTLDRDSDVRIYALGEASSRSMVDYGWIEDARSGRTVWEMKYRTTEPAGGASKNRKFDGTIRLPAGEYVLRYESDGSHSFGDWNADPPDDPEAWGITVFRVLR
jgi:hypothetical protein